MAIASFTAAETPPAADLQDLATRLTIVSDTTVGTPATNFTDSGCFALTADNGKLIELVFKITTTNLVSQTSGNVTPDLLMFTVDTAYRPAVARNVFMTGGGTASGGAVLGTDGTLTLQTSSANIAAAALIIGNVTFFNSAGS